MSDVVGSVEPVRSGLQWEAMQARIAEFLRPLCERRNLVPVVIFAFFSIMLIALKLIRQDQQYEDSALYFQVTQNIADRGVAESSVFAAIDDFGIRQRVPIMTAQQIAQSPMAPNPTPEMNYLQFHAHYILYPIAILARVLPSRVVLLSLYMLSFTGLILLSYFALRAEGIPVAAAGLFCLLVVSHPAWSQGLEWQFYPERLFVFAGFVLMYLTSRQGTGWIVLTVVGVVCASIIERTGIMAGIFLLLYTALYWKRDIGERAFRLGLGAALLLYGVFVLKFVITNNEYATYLPTSVDGFLWNFFHYPGFQANLGMFMLINGILLVVALFEWRAAVIAVVFMLPNMVGNIGGAEKVAWMTHYHDIYLPALVWAAFLGFTRAYRMAVARPNGLPAFYAGIGVLILFLASIDPYSAAKPSISLVNLSNQFFPKFFADSNYYFGPGGQTLDAAFADLGRAVPESAVVTTPEVGMPELYPGRTIRFFPIDVDHAGYAVLHYTTSPSGIVYAGATTYLGPQVAASIDQVLLPRMHRDGYDFAHPVLIPRLGLAVLARKHAAGS